MFSLTVFYLKKFTKSSALLCLAVLAVLLNNSGCDDKNTSTGTDTLCYSLYIMDKEGNEFLVPVASLEKDSIVPEETGIKLDLQQMQRDLIVRDGYCYRKSGDLFHKYRITEKALVPSGTVKLEDFYVYNYLWLHQDTLLLIAIDKSSQQVKYAKVYTPEMQLVQTAPMDIRPPFGKYSFISVGVSYLKNDRLFVGYAYHFHGAKDLYTTGDTSYVAVLKYPEMRVLNVIRDTHSTYPGNENTIEPGSFADENGDFYFIASPGVAMGNHPTKPTGIYRIKKDDTTLDSSYFFDISSSPVNNHAYSIYYIGNGKAIIRNERKDLFTSWNEHWKVPHFEFYVLDLKTHQVTKLALPLDKGTRRQCVLWEGNNVYISINSDKEGNYIWIYNLKDGSLTKGLKIGGNSDFILRMDKMR